MFDFDVISSKMEFILDKCDSYMDLLDTIAFYGNAAFVAFRSIIFKHIVELHQDSDYDYYEDEYIEKLFFPNPEVYQWIIHPQFLNRINYRSTGLFWSIEDCEADMKKQHDYVPYLTKLDYKPMFLIESTPILHEQKKDFFFNTIGMKVYKRDNYVPHTQFKPGK